MISVWLYEMVRAAVYGYIAAIMAVALVTSRYNNYL